MPAATAYLTSYEVAAELECTSRTVQRIAGILGMNTKIGGALVFTRSDVQKIRRYRKENTVGRPRK